MIEAWTEEGYLEPIDRYFAERITACKRGSSFGSCFDGGIAPRAFMRLSLDTPNFMAPGCGAWLRAVALPEEIVGEGKPLYRFGERIYLQKNWQFETRFIEHVQRLMNTPLEKLALLVSGQLNAEQKKAVELALAFPLTLLAGGPGTGKTHTAAELAAAFAGKKIMVGAPTGKAAANLEAKIQGRVQCGTLHALLGLRGGADLQKAGPDLDAELILIDECSMLDAELFVHFLGRVRAGTRVVLMGDPEQLPPVEAGSLFADLVESEAVPTTLLTQCLRSEREEVLNLAAAIRHQRVEEVVASSRQDLLESGGLERLFQAVKGEDFSQFRILSTVRKGPFGVDAINQLLAARLRSPQVPIMITRNDYRLGLSNGETGMLQGELAHFPGKEPIARAALPSFEYAYALSVHKSQGSEYKRVLFLLPPGSEVFGREVLYTGVTRARDRIELQASEETLRNTLKNGSRKLSSVREGINPFS